MLIPRDAIIAYYRDPNVRARMWEFITNPAGTHFGCMFISSCDDGVSGAPVPRAPECLNAYWSEGREVARSLWDRDAVVAHIDMEYVNADFPAEAYLHAQRAFEVQAPMLQAVQSLLAQYGIPAVHLLSGRGHHLTWKIEMGTPAYEALEELGRPAPHLIRFYRHHAAPGGEIVSESMARAFSGLGLLMEFFGHRVLDLCVANSTVPPQLTAVKVGTGARGRESVSLDLSEYGDPLSTRMIRVPFGIYLKPWKRPGIFHPGAADDLLPFFLIPASDHTLSEGDGLMTMRDPDACKLLAVGSTTTVPGGAEATMRMVNDYRRSDVAAFHEYFYSREHETPENWPRTYDRLEVGTLPPCVANVLEHPNDLLLKPAGIQMVVRSLLALNWHPRHIAGMIRSRYEHDFGWGVLWFIYDAATRADFYTRLFSGLALTGRDRLIDFNCTSTGEKDFCVSPAIPCDLRHLYERLLRRVTK